MPYTLRADWTVDCIPQNPVVMSQRPDETAEEFEDRFDEAVAAAMDVTGPADPPGACP